MAENNTSTQTSGGAAVGGDANVGGNFTGRDQITINFFGKDGPWVEAISQLFPKPEERVAAQLWATFNWAESEQAYRDKLIRLYDKVRILGKPGEQPLGDLFTAVYILNKRTAHQRHALEELQRRGFDRDEFQRQPGERIDGLELVKQGRNLFILGKPGAGKTTFLKHVAVQTARQPLGRVPIFVNLNEWAASRWGKGERADLFPFLVEQFAICNFPDASRFIDYLLRDGRGLVLFDGLDEVRQEQNQRHTLTHLLQAFARQYDRSQHLITCRIAANEYVFTGFDDVEVADFTPTQVTEYATKWFGAETPKLAAFQSELAKPEHAGLRELGNLPLLLSLLCLTFDENMRFPPNRAELYEDALETLLRKWDTSRSIQRDQIYRTLSPKRKVQLFGRIAWRTFEQGQLFFRRRDLATWIDEYLAALPGAAPAAEINGGDVLRAIEAQHSIFVERATDIYAFSHLTFQEYFTARHVMEEQQDRALMAHLTDRRWRETFLLTAAMRSDASEFFNIMRWAIDKSVSQTPKLSQVLQWSGERAHIGVGERIPAIRLVYIGLTLARRREREREYNLTPVLNLSRVLDSDRTLDLDIAFALARVRARASDIALNLASTRTLSLTRFLNLAGEIAGAIGLTRALDQKFPHPREYERELDLANSLGSGLDLALALALAVDLANHLAPAVGIDSGLYYAWGYAVLFASTRRSRQKRDVQTALTDYPSLLDGVIDLAQQADLSILAQSLRALVVPVYTAAAQQWEPLADALHALLLNRELVQEWKFTEEEIDKFDNYLYANELLVRCLEVAVVPDRQALLAGLLAPPA